MSTIIKPCPFCGGSDIDEAFVRSYKSGDQSQPIIAAGCHSCGASGPDTNVPDHPTGYKESINKWNDRAEIERLQARVAELECMVKVFRACIDMQTFPRQGSTCHDKIHALVGESMEDDQ